ncbi:MAG: lantibiotic dehydratase [Peptoniphilus harei]|nr:lantibiotic dehydratase [Peptoniphilus harei]
MRYTIHDYFMIRTPALPLHYLEKFRNSNKDIYTFIKEDDFLDDFFKKALLLSSKSLYFAYINKPNKENKYKNLCEGLLKYFIRATSRPTPYGYYANVSIGNFASNTELKKLFKIIDIKVDTDWANGLIKNLEDDFVVLNKLSLIFNDICYVSGDRLKNPYFTNRGNLKHKSEEIKENTIKYTGLVRLVREKSKEFIGYEDLFKIIKENYRDVDDLLIHNTIKSLVENEYIFTNLRIPAYCNNTLEHLIYNLENIQEIKYISNSLKKLNHLFKEYVKKEELNILEEIIEIMQMLNNTNNYIELNVGCTYSHKSLDEKLKNKIENFVNNFSKISPENKNFIHLDEFKHKFLEKYGINVEVDLIDIIDENKFNGFKYLKTPYSQNSREIQINKIIKNKIEKAIFNKEEVYLTEEDFKDIDNKNINLVDGFDLNLFITKSNDDYNLIVGPNAGSSKEGAMFQRFKSAFLKEDFDKYNEIYIKSKGIIQDEYLEVELRECAVSGRTSNVINNTKNYEYYLPIGLVGNKRKTLNINDLLIGIDEKEKLYVKSKSLNKKLKFIKDNMLNINLNSNIYKLLYEISSLDEDIPVNRIFLIGADRYIYSPRIYYEGVIVALKKWKFDYVDLNIEDYNKFKYDLEHLRNEYLIDDLVYLTENDNRLILDLNREEDLQIIYSNYKKSKEVKLTEIEPNIKDSLVKDEYDDTYVNEFVFSVLLEKDKDTYKNIEYHLNKKLQNKNQIYLPFIDGWIYLKLYGVENRLDELLTKQLGIFKELGDFKWFFIRYEDVQGKHLRIRFKFKNQDEALEKYKIINKWLGDLYDIKMINKVELDTYEREINRYGGAKLIDLFEEYSQISSELTIDTLKNCKADDMEKMCFLQVFSIYTILSNNLEDLFNLVDKEGIRKEFRKEYNQNRENLMKISEDIINCKYNEFEQLRPYVYKLNIILKKYRREIEYLYKDNKLSNSEFMIIGSLIHMHCNRLKGDRNLEYKTSVLIRHTVYDLINKYRNLKE